MFALGQQAKPWPPRRPGVALRRTGGAVGEGLAEAPAASQKQPTKERKKRAGGGGGRGIVSFFLLFEGKAGQTIFFFSSSFFEKQTSLSRRVSMARAEPFHFRCALLFLFCFEEQICGHSEGEK